MPSISTRPDPRHRIELHIRAWKSCQKCSLSEHRKSVCLGRGEWDERGRGPLPETAEVVFIGEAPGLCISGETLIDVAHRDKSLYPDGIPVKDLVGKTGLKVYSYDLDRQRLAVGTVKWVRKTGYKKVYRVSFFWWAARPKGAGGRVKKFGSIVVTDNHPFLLKSKGNYSIAVGYRSIKDGLAVGDSLQPFYRQVTSEGRGRVGVRSAEMVFEAPYLLADTLGRKLVEGEECHHKNRNKSDDTIGNLELLTTAEHAREHSLSDNPMFVQEHRDTHKKIMQSEDYRRNMSETMKRVLSTPEARAKRKAECQKSSAKISASVKAKFATDPGYYFRYLKGKKLPKSRIRQKMSERFPEVPYPPPEVDNHEVTKIEYVGVRAVYDLEVERYHNFAANGVFIHNSEDALGETFVGPAGQLLDHIARDAGVLEHTCAWTNVVACIPKTEGGEKNSKPPDSAMKACLPRLREFLDIMRPRLLVLVGEVAEKWVVRHEVDLGVESIRKVPILHPAYILRSPQVGRGLAIRRTINALRVAVRDEFGSGLFD